MLDPGEGGEARQIDPVAAGVVKLRHEAAVGDRGFVAFAEATGGGVVLEQGLEGRESLGDPVPGTTSLFAPRPRRTPSPGTSIP